jgi:hypothetical protein
MACRWWIMRMCRDARLSQMLITVGLQAVTIATVAVGAAALIKPQAMQWVNPKSLLSRQGPREMRQSHVEGLSELMMVNGFRWGESPIAVVERNGVQVIIDGHHRAAAAILARIR